LKLKELFAARDMTQGSPGKRIMEFAIPMLIGNVAQQLYNTADSIIVGRAVGDNALAAVGSASPILFLLMAIFVGVSTGAGIVVSQSYGAKDRTALSEYIGNCMSLAAIATVLIMIIGPVVTRPLLELLGTPASIINDCAKYLHIYFIGIVGFFFYNMLSGVLRGMGDSVSALVFLLVAAVLNVVLDLLFVKRMAVAGVALATVISQAVSAVLCCIRLARMKELFDFNLKTMRMSKERAMTILRIGIPSGITQGIMAMASMVVQRLTNSMGEVVIACNVVIMRVDGFAMMPNFSFGQAMSVYAGQNVGAGRLDRISKGTKQGSVIALAFAAVITVILLFFGKVLFSFFTTTQSLITLADNMMKIMAVGYLGVAITQVLGGVMRGAGDTVTPMVISLVSTILFRVPVAYILAHFSKTAAYPNGQPWALFGSLMISWVFGMILSVIFYAKGKKWKEKMHAMASEYNNSDI